MRLAHLLDYHYTILHKTNRHNKVRYVSYSFARTATLNMEGRDQPPQNILIAVEVVFRNTHLNPPTVLFPSLGFLYGYLIIYFRISFNIRGEIF